MEVRETSQPMREKILMELADVCFVLFLKLFNYL